MGLLWEHFVLNEMQGVLQTRNIGYWRNKQGNEIDFILAERTNAPIAIECKWSMQNIDLKNILAFRRQYPEGKNYIVVQDAERSQTKTSDSILVKIINLNDFINELSSIKLSPVKF